MNGRDDNRDSLTGGQYLTRDQTKYIYKNSLQYMGNEIFIENKKMCMKPLRNRLEAIQKQQPPKTPKGCKALQE